jgi:DNA-binding response OmpR family regulator
MNARDIKLLVVDDDPFFVRVLEKRFGAEGFQVMSARDGREGMKVIVTFEPDLVISDWMMPEVDGLELCQSVKTGLRDAAPYFILLTAKGEIDDKLLGLETGADDYLIKPCDHGELMARVRAGLRIVNLTKQLRSAIQDLKGTPGAPGKDRDPAPAPADAAIRTACRSCDRVQGSDGQWRSLDSHREWRAANGGDVECPHCAQGENREVA